MAHLCDNIQAPDALAKHLSAYMILLLYFPASLPVNLWDEGKIPLLWLNCFHSIYKQPQTAK